MTKPRAGALAFVVIGAVVFAFWQHQQIEGLVAERAVLHDQIRKAASQRDEIQRLSALVKATVESSEADRREVMRLRAQSSKLRQVEQENARLKIEGQRLPSVVAQARQGSALSDQQQKKLPASDVNVPSTPTGVTDLGVIELSDTTPTRLELGEGKECVVSAIMLDDGQLQMVFTFESEVDGVPIQTKQTATVHPGRQIAKIIGDVEIALTPTLKPK